MSRDPKYGATERVDRWLPDAEATSRRLAAQLGLSSDTSVYGEHCVNCAERWCLPADEATCPHKPICEDCWPNGCEQCEAEVEEDLRRREAASQRILAAALELRTSADDLSEADLAVLDWRVRKDIGRHVELAIEALRRVDDVMRAQNERRPRT
jgi:hypothetical protein